MEEERYSGAITMAEVVGRALMDAEFRGALVKDTRQTLRIVGARADSAQLKALAKLDMNDWESMTLQQVNDRIGHLAAKKITRVIITD